MTIERSLGISLPIITRLIERHERYYKARVPNLRVADEPHPDLGYHWWVGDCPHGSRPDAMTVDPITGFWDCECGLGEEPCSPYLLERCLDNSIDHDTATKEEEDAWFLRTHATVRALMDGEVPA